MSTWRGRSKGSSDVIRRGSAFRPAVPESYDPFPESHTVNPPLPLSAADEELVNVQRLLVNHLLNPGDEALMRVHMGAAESLLLALSEEGKKTELWKRLASDVGACYYPSELMTDSRSILMGIAKKSSASSAAKLSKSLAALENSEGKGEGEPGEQSPKSVAGESESDESIGGEDYNVRFDYEDEGARDDYDDGDDGGGGDYGGEF